MSHEETIHVKQSKVDMLTRQYVFIMCEGESIWETHTRFTVIANELFYLGKVILTHKQVKKFISILPNIREYKFDTITEAMDLNKMQMNKLIENLKTYEMLKKLRKLKIEHKVEKDLVLKASKEFIRVEDKETTYIAKKVLKALRKSGALTKREDSNKILKEGKGSNTYHRCGNLAHYIKYCPMHKIDYK